MIIYMMIFRVSAIILYWVRVWDYGFSVKVLAFRAEGVRYDQGKGGKGWQMGLVGGKILLHSALSIMCLCYLFLPSQQL